MHFGVIAHVTELAAYRWGNWAFGVAGQVVDWSTPLFYIRIFLLYFRGHSLTSDC